jgi:TPP-dependent pyruvate/acetoin dehydrogenase alpha subunit
MVAITVTFRERLRAFELSLQKRMPEFKCSVHLCLGQEDVPEQLHAWLKPDDFVFSTHRSHGHFLAKGGSEQKLLDEILGLETGVNGGFSGSQSFCDPELRFHSTAVVGGLIGVATGTALALKLNGSSAVAVCCIGDGAAEQGICWESLNFAALHRLPILYVCENNGLSVHAPLRLRQARPLEPRVLAFGIEHYSGAPAIGACLSKREMLPAFVEVECERQCNHVSAMEQMPDR